MGVLYLTVELTLDLLACLLGGILMLRARDNGPKFWWGSIALAIGGVFAWENIDWLLIVAEEPDYRFTDLLDMEKMLKWYPLASIVALFPLASLFPGYLTWKRTLLYLAPSFLITAIGAGYLAWYGELTPLYDFSEVVVHMDHPDVWFRCILFLLSIVTPLAFFLYPLLSRKGYRRVNSMMYVFMGFCFCASTFFSRGTSAILSSIFSGQRPLSSLCSFPGNICCARIPFRYMMPLRRQPVLLLWRGIRCLSSGRSKTIFRECVPAEPATRCSSCPRHCIRMSSRFQRR